jgi:hypothetical protein
VKNIKKGELKKSEWKKCEKDRRKWNLNRQKICKGEDNKVK